jgi:prophage tail gpP-like protein
MAPDQVKSIEKKEYTIVSSVETGETAEVTYMEEGATESAVLPMKKVDGEWLVDISKDKEDTGGGEEEVGIEEEVPTEDITETEAVATEEVVE